MKLTKLNELVENGKVLKGRWELGKDHEVQFRSFEKDEEVRVKAALVAAEPDALVIAVTEKQSDQLITTSLWKLSGTWSANQKNQLVFSAERESGKNNVLTFSGGWRVGEFQEILYSYEVRDLKTRRKEYKLLVFKGVWDITDKNGLTYTLSEDSDSRFRFRGALQTKSILAKKGELRYQIGVEVSGKRELQNVILFGKWKYSDRTGLFFEMEYEEGRRKSIAFGGNYSMTDSQTITVELKSEIGSPLGAEVILTKDLFGKDGQAFIRLRKSIEESAAEAGVHFQW